MCLGRRPGHQGNGSQQHAPDCTDRGIQHQHRCVLREVAYLPAIQEVDAEGPLLTSPTHPNSPDTPSAKHASCVYTTTSDKEYRDASGSEGLLIQCAITASLCSTGDSNRSNAGDINLGEPDKTTSEAGLPDPPSDYDEDSTDIEDATNSTPLAMGEVCAMPWSL